MINRDVLATFPCRVRRRGQLPAAAPSHMPSQRLRRLDRCSSLSGYRRANAKYGSATPFADVS